MAIPSRQIGWGTEENLLYEISKQLEALTGVISKIGVTPTTTTTTTASPSSYSWNLVGGNSYSCASMVSISTVYTSVSTLGDGVYIYTDEALTIPYSGYTYVSNNTTIWVMSSGMLAAGGPC